MFLITPTNIYSRLSISRTPQGFKKLFNITKVQDIEKYAVAVINKVKVIGDTDEGEEW